MTGAISAYARAMVATLHAATFPRARDGARRRGPVVLAVSAWLVLIGAAVAWGQLLQPGTNLFVGPLPPFIGQVDVRPGLSLLPAVAVAALVVGLGPVAAARLRWRQLLAASWGATALWAVALAASDGWARLSAPLARVEDYRTTLPALDSGVGAFLRTFVTDLPSYSTHTRGHPPGPVLVVKLLEWLGLPGPGWQAAVVIAAGASAAAAVAVTVRTLDGEAAARRTLPFLVLAPAALWVATSMDALFLGVSAWGVALLAVAAHATGRRAAAPAVAAGLLLGGMLFLSYGLLPLGALALAVGLRRPRVLAVAAAGLAAVFVAFAVAGFWWPAGVAATSVEWSRGHGAGRLYWYFLLGDLALLAVLVGPAAAAGLSRLRDRRLWLLVGAALLAVAVSDLGGFSRGEVERIWLPFAPWILVATAALPGRGRSWLAAQAVVALAVQAVVVSPW